MPGIVGIISTSTPERNQEMLRLMLQSMMHEHFYTSGTYVNSEFGIFSGWVCHQGAFDDCQPILNEDHSVALLFSGECYPESDTLTGLRRLGHEFDSSNGSWLVHLYEEQGDNFFESLNGCFSGLILDQKKKKVTLFTDRFGLNRIYCRQAEDAFFFASEAKAILRVCPETREFNEEAVIEQLAYGCTLNWKTLFKGIELLPGGTLILSDGVSQLRKRYFDPSAWKNNSPLNFQEYQTRFQEVCKRVFPYYLDSNSKIGISLTAGLDTRMIMACRRRDQTSPICYTFAGSEGQTFDVRFARQIAEACDLEHEVLRIRHDFLDNFADYAERTVHITDGCFGLCGSHEIYLNSLARELAPTRLTGNYGSEILRGVTTLKPVPLEIRLFSGDIQSQLKTVQFEASSNGHPAYFAAFKEIPWHLYGCFSAARSQLTIRTPYLDNEIVALALHGSPETLSSPQPSLSLIAHNDSLLLKIPTDRGLFGTESSLWTALRRVAYESTFKLDYYYNEGMPHWLCRLDSPLGYLNSKSLLFGHHKFLLYRKWLRSELAEYIKEILTDSNTLQRPYWNRAFVEKMAMDHISGRKNYVLEINSVITLELIQRLLLRST